MTAFSSASNPRTSSSMPKQRLSSCRNFNRREFAALLHKPGRLVMLPLLLLLSSCQQEIATKGRSTPLEPSAFFKDGRSARPQPEGTVAQGQLRDDTLLHTGMQNSKMSPTFPFTITRATLERGQDRYNIFCAPCHDRAGTGKGVVIPLGFERGPESF